MHLITMQDRDKVNSDEEVNPPLPVEELYTAVKKKPKGSSVPMNEPLSQAAEHLYTAVMKKPKDALVLPTSLHAIEELYAAVNKNPNGNTMEDEEEAPPIPPHNVEDTML